MTVLRGTTLVSHTRRPYYIVISWKTAAKHVTELFIIPQNFLSDLKRKGIFCFKKEDITEWVGLATLEDLATIPEMD